MKTSTKALFAATPLVLALAAACWPSRAAADGGPARNPFRFDRAHGAQKTERDEPRRPTLKMTLLSGDTRIAVFDGREYGVGDKVGDFIITAIGAGTVTARGEDGDVLFTLEGGGDDGVR